MLMTPSKANNVAFPKKGGHSENAEEIVAKFQTTAVLWAVDLMKLRSKGSPVTLKTL
jgi:hypothetical protein